MKLFLLATIFATQAAVDCCDGNHAHYQQATQNVQLCTARGGVPITSHFVDDGGHYFDVLTSCAFPCDQRLAVEK